MVIQGSKWFARNVSVTSSSCWSRCLNYVVFSAVEKFAWFCLKWLWRRGLSGLALYKNIVLHESSRFSMSLCPSLIPGGLRLKIAISYCTSSVLGKQPLLQILACNRPLPRRSSAGRWLLQQQLPGSAWAWKLLTFSAFNTFQHTISPNNLMIIWCTLIISLYPACPLGMILFQSLLWWKCIPVSRARFKYCPGTTCGTIVPHSAKPPVSSKTSVAFQHEEWTHGKANVCWGMPLNASQPILELGGWCSIYIYNR